MRSAISESKHGLGDLTKTVKALSSTIRISSRQVRHNVDNDDGKSSYDVKGKVEEVLSDIISQEEQQTFFTGGYHQVRRGERRKKIFGEEMGPDPLEGRI